MAKVICGVSGTVFGARATQVIAQPAVPASGVAVPNGDGQAFTVVISGGTITSVVIGGVQAGTGPGTYTLPVGQSIAVVYSAAAPTWTWTLPVVFIPSKNADGSPVSRTGHG